MSVSIYYDFRIKESIKKRKSKVIMTQDQSKKLKIRSSSTIIGSRLIPIKCHITEKCNLTDKALKGIFAASTESQNQKHVGLSFNPAEFFQLNECCEISNFDSRCILNAIFTTMCDKHRHIR